MGGYSGVKYCRICGRGHIQPPIPCRQNKIYQRSLQLTIHSYNAYSAQLLQKWQDSFACIVWSCNGKAVNLKNSPIFTTLVKMTSPATVSGGVRIRKFSVRVSSWMLARDPCSPQNCNLSLPVTPRPESL